MAEPVKDMRGVQILAGDEIAISQRRGSSAWIGVFKVIETHHAPFTTKRPSVVYADRRPGNKRKYTRDSSTVVVLPKLDG